MGIEQKLDGVLELLKKEDEENNKKKKFKFPFGKKVGRGQRKKNYVTVLILGENGVYEFKKYQIQDQTIIHDTIPRLASAGYVMFDKKGNPLIILPNWSVKPISPMDNYKESLEDGSNQIGYRLLMSRMKTEVLSGKAKVGKLLPWVLGAGLIGIILYAFLSSGGT